MAELSSKQKEEEDEKSIEQVSKECAKETTGLSLLFGLQTNSLRFSSFEFC